MMDVRRLDSLIEERKRIVAELSYLGFIVKLNDLPAFKQWLDGARKRRDLIPEQVLAVNPLDSDKTLTVGIAQIQAKKQAYDYEIGMIDGAVGRSKELRIAIQEIDKQMRAMTAPKRTGVTPPRD